MAETVGQNQSQVGEATMSPNEAWGNIAQLAVAAADGDELAKLQLDIIYQIQVARSKFLEAQLETSKIQIQLAADDILMERFLRL